MEYFGTDLPKPYDEPLMDKVIVIMTDGKNQYYRWPGSKDYDDSYPFDSDYGAYRRLDDGLLDGISSKSAARAEVDARMAETCEAMKAQGITIYALTFAAAARTSRRRICSVLARRRRATILTHPAVKT